MFRTFLAAIALSLAALPAMAQQLSLGQVSQYLNTLQTVKSPFTQINADGTISTGEIWIKRPGKARFDYNPPERGLVLVSSGAVYVMDRKLGGNPETYPLNQTPLSIILARNVDLARAGMVTGHGYDGTATTVTAQDPKRPEYGSIQMKFTGNPVELRQWIITDGDGTKTTVVLGGLEKASIPTSEFLIDTELNR
ncbi:outer membrane lipoprotein carrier protein LolA [Sagittula sp. NFXS13]|nr:outer membrane lipoprotein carrier protein LolA [Sagittula marina]